MSVFFVAHVALVALVAHQIQPALWDMYMYDQGASRRFQLQHFCYTEQRELVQAKARRHIAMHAICYLVAASYIHAYSNQHGVLVAALEAARSQPPPYGCKGNMRGWDDLSLSERIQLTIGHSTESACSQYLERIHASVWPSPLLIGGLVTSAADVAGNALARFLSPHSLFIQVLLVALSVALPVGAALLLAQVGCGGCVAAAARTRGSGKKRRQLQLQPAEPADARCLLTDDEGHTPKHIP